MKYWYGLLGFVSVMAILGVGVLVAWPVAQPKTATPATKNITLSQKTVKAALSTNRSVTPATTLTFVGDIMLDRYVRTTINQHSPTWPFEKVRQELVGDLVVGNLEGPITNSPSVATNTNLIFTFDPKHTSGLVDAGFTHLSLANNHTLNFDESGLANTRSVLNEKGLHNFGDPKNRNGFSLTIELNNHRVTLIGYHGLVSGRDNVVTEIQQAKSKKDLVIVVPHWGNEYQLRASTKQTDDAHTFIDAGADLIIGAHPHVIQPIEVYRGKMIFYSLGNFLFDQYFSPATQRGLLVRFTLDDGVILAALIPVVIRSGQVQLPDPAERDTILSSLAHNSTVTTDLKNNISRGRLTLPFVP